MIALYRTEFKCGYLCPYNYLTTAEAVYNSKYLMHHLHTEQTVNSSLVEQRVTVLSSLSIRLEGREGVSSKPVHPCMKVNPLLVCVLFIH